MKGVIYARYSSERQTEQSIEGQIRECTAYAEQNGISVIAHYIDRAKTGTNDQRDEFQRMLRDSHSGAFDCVIVWKIDRFGRNRYDIAKNKAILKHNGVALLYATEHIPDGPEGIILEGLLESLAEYYSAELKTKITRGMRESAYKCQFNGSGLPTGYKIDENKKFVIDEEGARIVRWIFTEYEKGMTVAEIRRQLTAKGIKTAKGNEWTHFGIQRILRNRRYLGEYRWHDIVIPGGIPRIIDDDQFERVQREMDKNKKAPSRARGGDRERYLLTGKIFCGYCKGTMFGNCSMKKSGLKFPYYTCRNRRVQHNGCKKGSVNRDWIEREVTRLTVERILQADRIEWIADRVVEIQTKEREDKSNIAYYENRLAEAERSIHNLMKAIEQGILTETTGTRLRELEAEREDLKIEIEREKIARPVIKREQVVFFLSEFRNGNVDDKEYQRRIIDLLVNKVWVYDDKLIITYNFSGEGSEISAEIVDQAAAEALSDVTDSASGTVDGADKCTSGPPNLTKSDCFVFFLPNGSFGLVAKIKDRV